MPNPIYFSVIIPTYKDWKRLQVCVNALMKQSLSVENFEILIVDNAKEHSIPKTFNIPSNLKILHEVKPGSYAARNKAVQQAKGEILAFTDSDCIPDKDWLENAWSTFKNKGSQRIGGKVQLFYKNPTRKTWAELYESVFAFNQKENVEKRKLSVTANFFVEKKIFTSIGFFDDSKMSGEDWGWNRRATNKGISIDYGSDIVVQHPARYKMTELTRKVKRVAGGMKVNRNPIKKCTKLIRLFLDKFIKPSQQVLKEKLTVIEKFKIIGVVVYLYLIYTLEYIKLLFGVKSKQ